MYGYDRTDTMYGGNGNVAICVTNTGKFLFYTYDTLERLRMVITNNGNVGIGTTDPQNKLHIRDGTTNTTVLTIHNNFTTATIQLVRILLMIHG
jgi:hypothetical protein